ncbi:MAG TPA: DNA polymerase/3'-5' exonuclease PolX [Patescibacteria group bacterium]|nr:DNA polymerase/3'-5' exonuclease PolX [Patescibacteria group bacterium]
MAEQPPGAAPLLTNAELAAIFHEIGSLLEVKGELVFKTVAYHRAADAIAHSPHEIAREYREGRPPAIPGVGSAISDKIAELAATGRLGFLDRIHGELPATLVELLEVPGVGPKTVRLLWERLGIETLDDLRTALRTGTLRGVPGISEKGIASVAAGVEAVDRRSSRMTLGTAERIIEGVVALLADVPGVRRVEPAGSFRRRRETIGDLDLLVETDDAAAAIERFVALPGVDPVVNSGAQKAAVRLAGGPQVDLMAMPPGACGTYLVHFTGSKEHNVRLRGIARERGWSLSEKGFARLGEDGEAASGAAAELRTFATEAEVYEFLGLAEVPPELREDRGEVEAAGEGRLPRLIEVADLRGDCHAHSDWSDGIHSIEQMAETARDRGYGYLVLTDHSHGLAIARGLTPERVAAQRAVIAELNARFAREEEAGTAPPTTPSGGFRLLHGCELEIRGDGSLDFDDELLASFDVVVAALHQGRRQPRAQLTARVLGAIASPHVDVIAHPAGRMLGERSRDDLDLAWDEIYAAAAATGTLLEIDGSDHRLDLAPERARLAVAAGCLLTIDSDAHRSEELAGIGWGVAQARRAWVAPSSVANTWPRDELLAWVAGKPRRVAATAVGAAARGERVAALSGGAAGALRGAADALRGVG